MKASYDDILKITEAAGHKPLWWDEAAVPRFVPFHPSFLHSPYARKCALIVIRCQGCRKEYTVAVSTKRCADEPPSYGDPPPHCGPECSAGYCTMSIPIKVLEIWERRRKGGEGAFLWHRTEYYLDPTEPVSSDDWESA